MSRLQVLRPDGEMLPASPSPAPDPAPLRVGRPYDAVHVALCGVTADDLATTERVLNALRAAVDGELHSDVLLYARRVGETADAHRKRVQPLHRSADHRHAALHLCDHLLYRYRDTLLRDDRHGANGRVPS